MLNDRNAEGEGLARSGGCLGNDVLPFAHRRNAARLHGGALLDILLFQRALYLFREAERIKAHALCEFHSVFLCFLIFSVMHDYIIAVNTGENITRRKKGTASLSLS